jgi:hypothetical protein
MKMKGTSNNWGGARLGSGRKNLSISQQQVKEMLKASKTWKVRAKGITMDDILMQIIYAPSYQGENIKISERLAAIKIFKEYTMAKVSEQNQNINIHQGPIIGLPPIRREHGTEEGQEGQGQERQRPGQGQQREVVH